MNTVPVRRGTLAAVGAGPESGPAAVLVPGLFGAKEDFAPLLPRLGGSGYRVWCYDQLGQFESGGPAEPDAYRLDALAADLCDVLDAVAPRRPVHLMGHCMGGFVARAATIAAPDRIASLTLLACGPDMGRPQHGVMLDRLDRYLRGEEQDGLGQRLERLLLRDDGLHRQVRAKLDRTSPAFLLGVSAALRVEPDRTDALRAAGVPVLVLYGQVSRRLWTVADFADMAARLGAASHELRGAAHAPNEERPAETCAALLRFWEPG